MMPDSQVLLSKEQQQQQQPITTTLNPDDADIGVLLLACRMRRALKCKTRNRLWHNLKVYKKCFLHSHAIAWLTQCAAMDTVKESLESSLDDTWSIQTDETFKCWMKTKFRSNSILEEEAVRLGNEMIRAGYVSHVANPNHIFTKGQTKTLYFRFHNKTIDEDVEIMKPEGLDRSVSRTAIVDASIRRNTTTVSTNSEARFHGSPTNEKLKDALIRLQVKTSRLLMAVETSTHSMNEANGRTAVLEAAVSSLTLGFIMIATGVLLYIITLEMRLLGLSRMVLISNTMLCLLVVWLFGENRRRKLEEHASILRSLAFSSMRQNSIFPVPTEYSETDSLISSLEKSSHEISEEEEHFQEQQQHERESIVAHLGREIKMRLSRTIKKSLLGPQPKPEGKQMRDVSTLPDPLTWPHRPVLLCVNTPVCPDLIVPYHGNGPCPLGVPFEFSSDLFEGSCLVRLRDIPSDDPASDALYFQGRKRRFQSVIQGRFKEELSVADVLTGHEFVRKLRRLPPNFVLSAATKLIGRLVPGGQVVLHSEQPQVLANLTASCQTVCADQPGNEPNITSNEFREDLSLLGGTFADHSMTSSQRKKHLSNPEKACRYKFDTETIYTFDFYQNLLDVGTYSLDLGFTNIGLAKSMDGQPIQVLSKTKDGRYLWSFQIWHEKLLSR